MKSYTEDTAAVILTTDQARQVYWEGAMLFLRVTRDDDTDMLDAATMTLGEMVEAVTFNLGNGWKLEKVSESFKNGFGASARRILELTG